MHAFIMANMDAFECIATKLDVREFSSQNISAEIKSKILEAARLTGSGLNTQHWRFIVVEEKKNLKKLAEDRYKWRLGFRRQFCSNCVDKPSAQIPHD